MSSTIVEAGSPLPDSSTAEQAMVKGIVDSMLTLSQCLPPNQPLVRVVNQLSEQLEGLTQRITFLEKRLILPGVCGCQEEKSGTSHLPSAGTPLAVSP